MNRRDLLALAPVAVIGCTAPASAGILSLDETPVAQACREWLVFREHICGPATKHLSNTEFDPLVEELDDMGLALLTIISQTPQDFIMKVIASTDWGQGGMPDIMDLPELWAEARAFVEGAHERYVQVHSPATRHAAGQSHSGNQHHPNHDHGERQRYCS